MKNKPGAVITGGDFQGLGVVRTLGRKGIPVLLLDSDHCIARYSRFKEKFIRSPHPAEPEPYLDFLIHLAKNEKIEGWVIFPNSDEAVYVLSRYKEILEKFYRVPTPRWEVIQNVYMKKETYRVAEENGIPVPKRYEVSGLEELEGLDLPYPLVIKPSIRHHFYNKTKIKGFRVNNKEELMKIYPQVSSVIDPSEIIVQDFIPGGPKNLYSYCPFFKDGKAITGVGARRARQHPMDFGHASTYVELVDIPELKNLAEKFLGLIDYYGIGEVEFMQDPRDHQYKLIEVNPRVWGWHTLATATGFDLPYLLYQDMIGEEIEIPLTTKQVKWVRLTTDIPTVFLEIAKGKMKMGEYLASMRGEKVDAVLSVDDPLPFVAEVALIPYLWRKRGF
jgi:predicted ATP-grasp superfamily ATP-dependent carboligase